MIIHQVSQVHTRLITERLGIDPDKCPKPTFFIIGMVKAPVVTTLAMADPLIDPMPAEAMIRGSIVSESRPAYTDVAAMTMGRDTRMIPAVSAP